MLPFIKGSGQHAVLYVNDKAFHLRAGEVHNSSASSPRYMNEHVWPAVRGLHLNTLIVPVFWECIEPKEGLFDFSLPDELIRQAEENQVRLVFLWFGLWKNGESTYVPEWVKTDRERFWYVRGPQGTYPEYFGRPSMTISPLCQAAVAADAKAFSTLMRHLREHDAHHTVILVQVENECGILGSARDHSPAAREAFASRVPETLLKDAGDANGSWETVFGEYAEEAFMAWHYAGAVGRIAHAGKEEYPLPMFVNAWLELDPWIPGTYPSGGPQFKNHEIWKAAAPDIDIYAPDIYVDYFKEVCAEYNSDGNPLFIPETRHEAAFFLYAVGKHNAMCFSPFAIEDIALEQSAMDPGTLALLHISEEAFRSPRQNAKKLSAAYAYLEQMEDLVTQAALQGRLFGFLPDTEEETLSLTGVDVTVTRETDDAAGGLILELAPCDFVVLAVGCSLTFRSQTPGTLLDILSKEEGRFVKEVWTRGRILNGDERYRHIFRDLSMQRFRLLPCS